MRERIGFRVGSRDFSNARLVFKPGADSVSVSVDLIADCLEDISLSCFFPKDLAEGVS